MSEPAPTRCGVVAMLGAPNAGKSTLVNRLVGSKVSIVTHKVQTTRAPVRGIAMRGETQLILTDLPGVFTPKSTLEKAMLKAAWRGTLDADVIVHVVDARAGLTDDVDLIRKGLEPCSSPPVLVLNKIDAIERPALLERAKQFNERGTYGATFMISALTGDGVEDLAAYLAKQMPLGPWLFPEDQVADAPMRMLAAEITREKLMLRLHDELPYESTVETESWKEQKDGSARVEQTIYVARESQKKIAIGEGGQVVKAIGAAARKDLEQMLGRRVHLFLTVKVRENWSEERARYTAMGLDWEA